MILEVPVREERETDAVPSRLAEVLAVERAGSTAVPEEGGGDAGESNPTCPLLSS